MLVCYSIVFVCIITVPLSSSGLIIAQRHKKYYICLYILRKKVGEIHTKMPTVVILKCSDYR